MILAGSGGAHYPICSDPAGAAQRQWLVDNKIRAANPS